MMRCSSQRRHCERSEAIQGHKKGLDCFVAALLAMTLRAHRLDIVAVGVEQEGGEIARAVVLARTRAAIVAAAGLQALGVKFLDRIMVGRAEGDVGACTVAVLAGVEPQRRFALGPKACAAVVARAQHIAQGFQGGFVETHAGVELFDLQSDVVVHGDLRSSARGGAVRRSPYLIPRDAFLENLALSLRSLAETQRRDAGGAMEGADEIREVAEPYVVSDRSEERRVG